MHAEPYSLASTIIILLPMLYFLFASMTFLLRQLSDPIVTWLLRGLLDTYFLAVVFCCAAGILAFASAGRPGVAAGIALIGACAIGARRWFLRRLDLQVRARDAGDALAVRQLRRLHVDAMLYNAVQTIVVIASISYVFASA